MRGHLANGFAKAICTLALTSCTILTREQPASSVEDALADGAVGTLATMVVDAVMEAHPPAQTRLTVDRQGPLGDAIEARLRDLGYGITPEAPALIYIASQYDSNSLYVAASMLDWRTDALYSLTTAGEWLPRSARSRRHDDVARWPAAPDQPQRPHPGAACETVRFVPGSLRQNVSREIAECGYEEGEWRLGPAGYIDDWLIDEAYTLTVANGIQGVLAALRNQYHIESQLRPVAGKVDFHYPEASR